MKYPIFFGLLIYLATTSCSTPTESRTSVSEVMDDVVSRFYSDFNRAQLDTIGEPFILQYLSEEEKDVLGSKYWNLKVNVPVTVSLMTDTDQDQAPFWLEDAGFLPTALEVQNVHSVYEVWQKNYTPGEINLGISGFDKHRPVYFLSIGTQNPEDKLEITPVFPTQQHFQTMEKGSFTYRDWDELILTEVPEELTGHTLLSTIRGRARESHLIDAFRTTDFPSSEQPDQVLLTWSDDPTTSMDVQWRASASVDHGTVHYWREGNSDTLSVKAGKFVMEDRLLQNDRFIHRFTAELEDLQPGTSYGYRIGSEIQESSKPHHFTTSKSEPAPFSFLWTGDVHNSEVWGEMMQKARVKHPESAFYMAAGDLVNTGLYRDDWDKLMAYPGEVFTEIPFMAVPGNHDNQDGLGAWMYREMFSYPENGPSKEMHELTYAFNYQNALFLMIDATFPVEEQTEWIEKQLASSQADWKFAVFHFSPYNSIAFYEDIIDEWGALFDRYHLDIVMGGHFHYYLRTKPLNDSKIVASPAEGTLYIMSIGATGKNKEMKPAPYAELQFAADHLYQHVEIAGNRLQYTSYGVDGEVKDQFRIDK